MKNKQISLFRDLSFCWDHFEQDGLTDAIVLRFMPSIVSPVLVVGSGQGLVSRTLLDNMQMYLQSTTSKMILFIIFEVSSTSQHVLQDMYRYCGRGVTTSTL